MTQALFNQNPTLWVNEKYLEIHQKKSMLLSGELQQAFEKRVDILSLEYFFRFLRPQNPLSQKVATIIYLCEMDPQYQMHFDLQQEASVLGVLLKFFGLGLQSAFRLLKGSLLYGFIKLRGRNR
jgi:hypothetical protein